MQSITSSRMASIDSNCEYLKINRLELMENEGSDCSAFIKGATGDLVFGKFGYGLLTMDFIDCIPR